MKRNEKFRLERHLIRPAVYHGATKFGVAMVVCLLWDRLANPSDLSINTHAFFFMAVFFAVLAWMGYLRMDGLRIPRIKMDFLKKIKKKPVRSYADMSDHIDEEVVNFSELEDEEKDVCRLWVNIVLFIVFLVLSFL